MSKSKDQKLSNVFAKMYRAAAVRVENVGGYNSAKAKIIVDGELEHTFDEKSRVSKALYSISVPDLEKRLSGGNYFTVNGKLVDFRDGINPSFVHTDQSIESLIEHVGVSLTSNGGTRSNESGTGEYALRAAYDEHGFDIPLYGEGGKFKSVLSYKWSPFMKDIHSEFELVRLICANGMTGMTSFMNTRIPLINRFEEHLDIASIQIQNKIDGMMTDRIEHMADQRASVAVCQTVSTHAHCRLTEGVNRGDARKRLENIFRISSPKIQLSTYYRESVFEQANKAAQLPGHLSVMDAWNMATEMSTHTDETANSSKLALDKFANDLVFNYEDLTGHFARYDTPPESVESDPERAFFGIITND